jgi:hypothetical protein
MNDTKTNAMIPTTPISVNKNREQRQMKRRKWKRAKRTT